MTAPTNDGVSRRNVIRGVAWSTPAVLLATATPSSAVSVTPQTSPKPVTATGTGITGSGTVWDVAINLSATASVTNIQAAVTLIVVNLNQFSAPAGRNGWTLSSVALPSKNNNPAYLLYTYPVLGAGTSTSTTVHLTFTHQVTSLVITGTVGSSTVTLYP